MTFLQSHEYKSSIKNIDVEERYDRLISRPIGYIFAKLAQTLGLSPHHVTVIATIIGVSGGACFYFQGNPLLIGIGACLILVSGILDSSDGQLARITGTSSEFGRILDGLYGYILFISIYDAASLSVINATSWSFAGISLLGFLCHVYRVQLFDQAKCNYLNWTSSELTQNEPPAATTSSSSSSQSIAYRLYDFYNWIQSKSAIPSQITSRWEIEKKQNPEQFIARYKTTFHPLLRLNSLLGGDNVHRFMLIGFSWIAQFDTYILLSIALTFPTIILQWVTRRKQDQLFPNPKSSSTI